jgi:hypothetical protein
MVSKSLLAAFDFSKWFCLLVHVLFYLTRYRIAQRSKHGGLGTISKALESTDLTVESCTPCHGMVLGA